MNLLGVVVILAVSSAAPQGSEGSCATANIETALKAVFERYPNAGELDLMRDSGEPVTPAFLSTAFKVRDVRNGYATLEHADLVEQYEAALFKNSSGYHLVIVSTGGSVSRLGVFRCDARGLVPDAQALSFSREDALKLYGDAGLIGKKGLTAQHLQDWAGSLVQFALPRKGRSIVLKAAVDEPAHLHGKKLGTVEYSDGRFTVHSLGKAKQASASAE
ncbi:hypothetical protein MYSTI_01874 [Myxococcus stipitatus DSM 14675]|uniref:Uncharacterized protein n=1 Tax=Myxococcus stipitatus (strain DSM 14675 / JCM 12634 / Mx s8) TaxID=1278073 RepID=L7U349_MYXSD|nr:hypothetical protein [Myxococcus stipitatus]AGC43206.1 hypothetical protein MYSTI_01874 [Myxococcus stipitatus DSM 14675]